MNRAELTRIKEVIAEIEPDEIFGIIPNDELELLLNRAHTYLGKWGKLWNQWMSQHHQETKRRIIRSMRFDLEVIMNEVDIAAQERFEELDNQYRQQNPPPDRETDRNAFLTWDVERLRSIEQRVLEEVVYQIPAAYPE